MVLTADAEVGKHNQSYLPDEGDCDEKCKWEGEDRQVKYPHIPPKYQEEADKKECIDNHRHYPV